jgi:hypothetical protein
MKLETKWEEGCIWKRGRRNGGNGFINSLNLAIKTMGNWFLCLIFLVLMSS